MPLGRARQPSAKQANLSSVSCGKIIQAGSDGFFVVPGIAKLVPQMPPGTCTESSAELTERFPELRYQEGILVMSIGGETKTSVRHAWNVGPNDEIVDTTNRPTVWLGQEVTFSYIPDDAKHDNDRRLLEQTVGPPADYDDDPQAREDAQLVLHWLAQLAEGSDNVEADEDAP